MEVSRQEQIFRTSEARLDLLLAQAMPQLGEYSINCVDESVHSYNYKESYLSWSVRLFRTWPQDITNQKEVINCEPSAKLRSANFLSSRDQELGSSNHHFVYDPSSAFVLVSPQEQI